KQRALGGAYSHWLDAWRNALQARVAGHGGWLDRLALYSGKKVQTALDRSAAAADALGRDIPIECGSAESFLASDYKLFHDAAKEQRYLVLTEILPRAGIYAA
ncbi:MAG: hypothetical protein H7176_06305, partial [Bdellovibrionales bacterium]|nr:hypothetical protein [Massilia sp.]